MQSEYATSGEKRDLRTSIGRAEKFDEEVRRRVEKTLARQEAERQSQFSRPEVVAAMSAVERAKERRDSVSRKLRGGSEAVTEADLAALEQELSVAKTSLEALAERYPALNGHQLLAP